MELSNDDSYSTKLFFYVTLLKIDDDRELESIMATAMRQVGKEHDDLLIAEMAGMDEETMRRETPPPIKVDAMCIFRLQGRSYKVKSPDSIAVLLYWIHRGMIHMEETHPIWELNWLIDDYDPHMTARTASQSVAIWCFSGVLDKFFKANPQYRGRARRGSVVSLNKLLLVSRLVYGLGMSDNDNFLYSDDTIKGFLRQYKTYPLPDYGDHYTKIPSKGVKIE